MTQTPELGAPEELSADDAKALARLLQRGLGKGFRLIILEVATWRVRSRILAWVRDQIALHSGSVVEIDVAELPGENLWSELGERITVDEGAPLVLALHGFQDAVHGQPDPQRGVYRQLNVQRDLFVRDVACVWLVMIHPQGSRHLQDIAPDFCDFVSLWIRASEPASTLPDAVKTIDLTGPMEVPEPLRRAHDAFVAGQYRRAGDLVDSFLLESPADDPSTGYAFLLRSRIEFALGNVITAKQAAERALHWSEKGDEELEAAAHHNLGTIVWQLGALSEARAHLDRALAQKTRLHGAEHIVTASTHQALAGLLKEEGELISAYDHIEHAIDIQNRTLGPDAPSLAISLHTMANISIAMGDWIGAQEQLERALSIQTRASGGEHHPDIAATLHSLATLLHARGDVESASELLERAMANQARTFGTEEHPAIAGSLHLLASIHAARGDFAKARACLERSVDIFTKAYGSDRHPAVATAQFNLAFLHRAQGDLEGALEMFARVLDIETQVYGTRAHPAPALTEANLARVLADRGEFERARPLAAHALETLTTTLGPAHPTTRAAAELVAELASAPE